MCQLCNLNVEKSEQFAGRMIESFNHASVSIMISLGHRTRLFDTMSITGAVTLEELAAKARLNRRYVKEWLASMTTARIVEYNAEEETYLLPAEHAAFLTRNAGSDNLATLFQFIPVMASVEEELLGSFRNGGGVPYERFYRFHEVMAEESGQNLGNNLISEILPLMTGMKEQLEAGISVLDIGCGSGTALHTLAKAFPKSTFTGIDLCKEPILQAVKVAENMQLGNINFLQLDATNFHFDEKFDLITTFDAVHDQAHPDKVLENIFRNLKEDGTYLMMDIYASSKLEENMDHPLAPALYAMSTSHCMTVSLAQNGMGLGTMWGHQKAFEMLEEAGFTSTHMERLEADIMNAYYISKK